MNHVRAALVTTAAFVVVAATNPPVAPGNRKAYCRGEVSGMYATRPAYVTTGKLLKARDGTTFVSGTVDKGSDGLKKFKCRFDVKGRFIDVMAMTPDSIVRLTRIWFVGAQIELDIANLGGTDCVRMWSNWAIWTIVGCHEPNWKSAVHYI